MFFRFFNYEVNVMPRGVCGKNPFNIFPKFTRKRVGFKRDTFVNWLGGTIVISRRN